MLRSPLKENKDDKFEFEGQGSTFRLEAGESPERMSDAKIVRQDELILKDSRDNEDSSVGLIAQPNELVDIEPTRLNEDTPTKDSTSFT